MIDIKDISYAPSLGEIGDYIGLPLFGTFVQYMDTEYKAICKIECVVYPKNGYFTVLVVVGNKEKEHVENQLPHLSKEIQELYQNTKEGNGQRWLMIDVHSDDCVYENVLQLIHIRRTSK